MTSASVTAVRIAQTKPLLHLNFNIDPAREAETLEALDSFERRFGEVNEAAVDAHFVLVARVLVDEGRLIDRELADAGREGQGAVDHGAGALRGIEDFGCRLVENMVIEGGQADAEARGGERKSLLCLLPRSLARRLSPFQSDVLLMQRRLL